MLSVIHLNASTSGGAFVVAQRLNIALQKGGKVHSNHLVFEGKSGNYELWANNWIKKKLAFGLHALEKADFYRFEKDTSVRFAFSHGLTGINIAEHPLIKAADIIHLHWINKGFISLKGLDNLLHSGKKIVWTNHDMWAFTGGCYHNRGCQNYRASCGNCMYLKQPRNSDLSRIVFENKMSQYATHKNLHFVSPSQWLANIAKQSGMGVGDRVTVIPNGIDVGIFKPLQRGEIRETLGILNNEKVILFIAGNLSNEYKGFMEFITTMKLVTQQLENVRIVVIGGRKPEFDETDLNIQFDGSIYDEGKLAAWYNAADLYVTTSLEENLPTTPIESLACGTPVAAFNVGGMEDIVTDNQNGYLSAIRENAALADKIRAHFQLDTNKIQDIREFAAQSVNPKFEIGSVANTYKNYYYNL